MQIILEIKKQKELQMLLQYLRFLPSAKIVEPTAVKVSANPPNGKLPFFDKYHGSIKSSLTLQEIDDRLQQLRQEWERNTW